VVSHIVTPGVNAAWILAAELLSIHLKMMNVSDNDMLLMVLNGIHLGEDMTQKNTLLLRAVHKAVV